MSLIDVLNQIWTQILNVTAIFVTPDWGFLVGFLPVIVVATVMTGASMLSLPKTEALPTFCITKRIPKTTGSL